jgi:capsular exopolysaccharide synthesis family protein
MDPIRDSQDSAPPGEPENVPGTSSTPKITAVKSRGASSPFLQEATKLVYKLFTAAGDPALSSVLFCGIDQAHNSSAICIRAAEILAAQMQKTVCVVDGNVRTPSMHRYFGLKNQRGFSDAILQAGPLRGFAHQLNDGNLWVMTAGTVQQQGLVFSGGEQLRSRILELRSLFDYVLIDAAPAGLFLDAVILGQLVDGAILVIESNSTKREMAFQAKEALEAAKVRILGAVLNSRKPT